MSEPTGPAKPRTTKGAAKANQDQPASDAQAAETHDAGSPVTESQPVTGAPAHEAPTSAIPAPTQPLPAAAPAGSTSLPGFSEAAPAGRPPVGPPSGPPPAGPVAGGPVGPPPKGPGLWRQATSTTGGLIAVVVAAALSALLVLGVVATIGLVAVRVAHHDGPGRMERVRDDSQVLPPGQQRKLDRMPQGPDSPRGQGNGKGKGLDDGLGNGLGNGMGNGMGPLMRGAMGLGDVQHGEFTVQQNGSAVVMTLQRGVVTKVSATSVTVKSDDGFSATYAIASDTRGRTGALANGDSVLVVAEKAGAKAVLVTATRQG